MWKAFRKPTVLSVPGYGSGWSPVFQWTKERRVWLHLSAFLVFSAIIHGAGFYLFQVVYPPPVRMEPDSDSIVVFNRSDPGVRTVIQQIQDRAIFFDPPSRLSGIEVRLEESEIRFAPSFPQPDLALFDPVFEWSFPPSAATAPVISQAEIPRSGHASSIAGEVFEDRIMAPWSILGEYLKRAEFLPRLRIKVRVDPEGGVIVGEIDPPLASSESEELKHLVESTLRFLPAAAESEGWIEIGPSE